MKKILKGIVQAISLACAFPFALLSLFGRIEPLYLIGAECFALLPGLPGDYVRIAYYRLTLEKCALESRIQFGSFFAHPRAAVGRDVYIGGYCVLGCTSIGDRTHLASGVQILSGRHQHGRDSAGNLLGANQSAFETVLIGSLLDWGRRDRDGGCGTGNHYRRRSDSLQTDTARHGGSGQSGSRDQND